MSDELDRKRLRELHGLKLAFNLKILLFYFLVVLDAWLILKLQWWPIKIIGYLIMANLFVGLGVFMHDGAHRLLFKNRVMNDWASRFISGTLLFSFTQFKVTHLKHHATPLTTRDPDIFFFHHNIPLTIMSGAVRYFSVTLRAISEIGTPKDRMSCFAEVVITLALWALLASVIWRKSWGWSFFQVYVVPYLLLGPITFARFVAEHFDCQPQDDYRLSRTCVSNSLCRWFWNNINFHTVHHFYPGIPWYNLPRAHKLMEGNLRENGSYIEIGYLSVIINGIRKYGIRRPTYWIFLNTIEASKRKRRPSLNNEESETRDSVAGKVQAGGM